jgi:hypothetical protein
MIASDGAFGLPGGALFSLDADGTRCAMRTWAAIFVEVGTKLCAAHCPE